MVISIVVIRFRFWVCKLMKLLFSVRVMKKWQMMVLRIIVRVVRISWCEGRMFLLMIIVVRLMMMVLIFMEILVLFWVCVNSVLVSVISVLEMVMLSRIMLLVLIFWVWVICGLELVVWIVRFFWVVKNQFSRSFVVIMMNISSSGWKMQLLSYFGCSRVNNVGLVISGMLGLFMMCRLIEQSVIIIRMLVSRFMIFSLMLSRLVVSLVSVLVVVVVRVVLYGFQLRVMRVVQIVLLSGKLLFIVRLGKCSRWKEMNMLSVMRLKIRLIFRVLNRENRDMIL